MRTAFLLTAYHQPIHLARLIGALSSDWASFFVHIDAKVDSRPFRQAVPPGKHILFLEGGQRATCYWGGFGLIQATLNLMRVAADSGITFHRYALLSGSDYPIKKRSNIHDAFCTEQEFIHIDRRLNDLGDSDHFRRYVRYYWFTDYPLLNRLNMSGKFMRPLYRALPLYQGSTWWSLTERCARYILSFVDNHADYVRYHRYTRVSDEIFFHTIVRNSPFSENIVQDFEKAREVWQLNEKNEYASHYIDWHAKVNRLPKVLNAADLSLLMESNALFARKFEEGVSDDVLAALDLEIRS